MSYPHAYSAGSLIRIGLLASICFSWPWTFSKAYWPGLLGPTRDGFAASTPELSDHSKNAPKLRWEIDAGQGYAGAAIQQDRVVMFFREGANDVIQAVVLDDGKSI
ncbi:MAG: hypothetical protein ACKOAH_25970, partial [Pirellula sp.]